MNLASKILLGMVLGIITGIILKLLPESYFINTFITNGLLNIVGEIFIRLLKMLVVPIVFVALVCGVSNIGNSKKLGNLGLKTFLLFLSLNVIAVSIGLFLATLFKVGASTHIPLQKTVSVNHTMTFKEIILHLIPTNPIEAMTQSNLLPIIVFALLIGTAISMAGKKGKVAAKVFQSFNAVLIKLIDIIMRLAPYGVFCLVSVIITKIGFSFLSGLLVYFCIVLLALLIQLFGVYSLFLLLLGKLNPLPFFQKMYSVMLFAFSTSSSNATIPINLEISENKLGVDNSTASFVIPLGANIHLNGTGIMQGVATIFIANVYNIPLSIATYFVIIAITTITAMSTAGIPSAGILTLAMVLKQAGLPVEAGIGLIFGVDRLIDMFRTVVNVSGNTVTACIVSNSVKELDKSQYYSK